MQKVNEISFNAEAGYEYVLTFFEEPANWQYEIVTISISLLDSKSTGLNLADTLSIARIFKEFLEENPHKILSYVCDDRPLYTSKRNQKLSPQEYRNKLFAAIFKKLNNGTYFKETLHLGKARKSNIYLLSDYQKMQPL